jgi:hypothetical protein
MNGVFCAAHHEISTERKQREKREKRKEREERRERGEERDEDTPTMDASRALISALFSSSTRSTSMFFLAHAWTAREKTRE